VVVSKLPPTLPQFAVNPDSSVNGCGNPVEAPNQISEAVTLLVTGLEISCRVTGAVEGNPAPAVNVQVSPGNESGTTVTVQVLAIRGTINGVWELPVEFSFNSAPDARQRRCVRRDSGFPLVGYWSGNPR
jgi:hypothetical protein